MKVTVVVPALLTVTDFGELVTPTATVPKLSEVGDTAIDCPTPVSNAGTTTVTFTGFALAGAHAGDYLITGTTCGATIAAGANCSVNVAFKPTRTGTRNAKLNIKNNGGGSLSSVNLAGAGN